MSARKTAAIVVAETTATTPPKATFYDWATPAQTEVVEVGPAVVEREKLRVALSHPVLRAVVNEREDEEPVLDRLRQFTPLSKRVAKENVARDARIGEAYVARRKALAQAGKLFDVVFKKPGQLGFKILLARGERSTRRRVLVDETFESCAAYEALRPRDELVAVDGDLIIELDPEAFGELVVRLRNKRPLTLTFAKGEGRDKAFAEQCQARAVYPASVRRFTAYCAGLAARLQVTASVVNTIEHFGLPHSTDDAKLQFCGAFCPAIAWEFNPHVNDVDYVCPLVVVCLTPTRRPTVRSST